MRDERHNVQAGTLRALAVTGTQRAAVLPNVPTMQEAGVKDYDAATWFALLAPAGTPQPIIDLLSARSDAILAGNEFREALAVQGAAVEGGPPERLAAYLKSELDKWGKAAKLAGIQPE